MTSNLFDEFKSHDADLQARELALGAAKSAFDLLADAQRDGLADRVLVHALEKFNIDPGAFLEAVTEGYKEWVK